jgi:hypothetical protein
LALHERRLPHFYYRYGFEHPVEDPWKAHDKIDWRSAIAGDRLARGAQESER